MADVKVDEIFDNSFVSMTKKLASLDLKRTHIDSFDEGTYKETVFTRGCFNAFIICEFSPEVFEDIVLKMNGEEFSSSEEKTLYINEYVNIVCGRVVSTINNQVGVASRLTVPCFHPKGEEVSEEVDKDEKIILGYDSGAGKMKVSVYYSFDRK